MKETGNLIARFWKLSLLLSAVSGSAWAQSADSATRLKEVIIHSSKIEDHSVGYHLEDLDSFALASNRAGTVTEVLTRNTAAHIRTYGPGALSGVNLRGTGSNHTAILWNGINLQSPTNGELDISQLPTVFVDKMSVQYGGAASLYGNGSIGGTVHLDNYIPLNRGFDMSLYQNLGSFGRHNQSYQLGWSGERIGATLSFYRLKATNDYTYRNSTLPGNPEERRMNSGQEQIGFLFQNRFKINESDDISIRVWFQNNELEVAQPITSGTDGEDEQDDDIARMLVTWNHQTEYYNSSLKVALIRHETVFGDFPQTIYSSSINEYEYNRKLFGTWLFEFGVNHTYDWVTSLNYGDQDPGRHRTAVFVAARKNLGKKALLNLRAREVLVDGDLTPFTPSAGLEYFLRKDITLKASLSRNYLIPTFNQLNWMGAGGFGNPALQPERSWNEEVGITYSPAGQRLSMTTEVSLFSNQVEDWILWVPVTASEWSPNNIKRVWSRGVQSSTLVNWKPGVVRLNFNLTYNYTRATNQEVAADGNQAELNKQLIYTPVHQGKINTTFVFRGYELGWWHQITGRQYTDGTNTEIQSLDPFGVSNVVLSKNFPLSELELGLQIEINNLFNNDYFARLGYPMPLRNYRFGLSLKL